MVMRSNTAQLCIIIIEEFKINRTHILAFVKIHGNLFHKKAPPFLETLFLLV